MVHCGTPAIRRSCCLFLVSQFCVIIICVTGFHCAFSVLAVFQRPLSAGADCAGAAAPSGGEKFHRSVQPAAADDQRQAERWPAAGGKLQGEAHISPGTCFMFKGGFLYRTTSPPKNTWTHLEAALVKYEEVQLLYGLLSKNVFVLC